jgi:glutamyl-tRNA synthetase
VARASSAPHEGEDGPRYPGTCRALSSAQATERARTRAPSLRLRVDPGEIDHTDLVFGPAREDVSQTVGDFVLRRGDGIASYQLAVVVDDAAMGVTDVIRGADLRGSTARQLLLYQALELPPPRFGHVPLVLGPDSARLSKRHGAIGVRAILGDGPAEPLMGWLGASLGLCPPGSAVTPRQLLDGFSLERLPRTPTVVDPAALQTLDR